MYISISSYTYTYRYIHIHINIYIHTSSTATTTMTHPHIHRGGEALETKESQQHQKQAEPHHSPTTTGGGDHDPSTGGGGGRRCTIYILVCIYIYSIIYIYTHIHEDSKSPHTYTSFWILLAFWVSIRDLRILPKDPWREVPWGELPDLAATTTERLQRLHHAMEVTSEAGRLGRWLGRWWFVRVVLC